MRVDLRARAWEGHAWTFGGFLRNEGEPPCGFMSLDSIVPPGPWNHSRPRSQVSKLARSLGDRQTFLLMQLKDGHR